MDHRNNGLKPIVLESDCLSESGIKRHKPNCSLGNFDHWLSICGKFKFLTQTGHRLFSRSVFCIVAWNQLQN